jgi:hypothetical protein
MHTNRYLFGTADPLKRSNFGVKSNGMEITLEGGAFDGLTMGAVFEVHLDQTSIVERRDPLGVLAITQTSPFSSTLAFPTGERKFTVPRSAVAVQVRTGVKEDLRLFVAREDAALMALFHQSMTICRSLNIIFVNNPSDANISFLLINGRVTCDIVQGMYGFSHRFEGIDTAEELFPILRDAVHFYSELNLHKMDDILGASRIIDLEFFQLGLSDQNYREISPISDNLNDNGIIDVVVSQSTNDIYGFKITNKTDEDLYTSIFIFNNTDFSIGEFFLYLFFIIENIILVGFLTNWVLQELITEPPSVQHTTLTYVSEKTVVRSQSVTDLELVVRRRYLFTYVKGTTST